MAFDVLSEFNAYETVRTGLQTRRSDKAKAFREYKEAKIANGETIDPYELDMVRMQAVGGDPYMAAMIPSGQALKDMTEQANRQSLNTRLKLNADMADQRGLERNYVQRIIDENWDKDKDSMAEVFTNAFGADGVRIYDQYRPEMDSLLAEATGKKYATLAKSPAASMVKTETDLQRFFPAEMRNEKTRQLLKTLLEENNRSRNIEDFNNINDAARNMPSFALEGDGKMAADFLAQSTGAPNAPSMPDGGGFAKSYAQNMSRLHTSQQQAKLSELASTSEHFKQSFESGDEEALFQSVKTLMVQAGMEAPQSTQDPRYIAAQQQLDIIGRTQTIKQYNVRKGELISVVSEEMEATKKNAGKRAQALQDASFDVKTYGDGKAIDPRITNVFNLIGTNPEFLPSEANLQLVISQIKADWAEGKEQFNPEAVVGKVLSSESLENLADATDRRVERQLELEYGIKPGTNFQIEYGKRVSYLDDNTTRQIQALSELIDSSAGGDKDLFNFVKQTGKEIESELIIQRDLLINTVNKINTDPSVRKSITGFNLNEANQMIIKLDKSIKDVQSINNTAIPSDIKNINEPSLNYNTLNEFEIKSPDLAMPFLTPYVQDEDGEFIENELHNELNSYLDALSMVESSNNPNAKAQTSSASGLFQFTRGTWSDMVRKYGQQYEISEEDIMNPQAQRLMASLFTLDNARTIAQKTGEVPGEKDLYLAHFLGANGAVKAIQNKGSYVLAKDLFPEAAQANKSIFYKDGVPLTMAEVYEKIGSKITRQIKKQST